MLRKAKVSDVKVIHRMINLSSNRGEMLPRSLMGLYGNLRDFFVYLDDDGSITGFCAMHIFWEQTEFFKSVGFVVTDKSELPEKVWSDCINCPKYPDFCDEVAMIIEP
ncbi:MAG: hypothetical protein JRC60_05340 [Deltaproteobacteria bacterium]|nr:hypothetical protein [Deltaproteobacteria bacterium]